MEIFAQPDTWVALLTLTFLEIVLGIDNIIFISLVAGKVEEKDQKKARLGGLSIALVMRILLLLSITWIIGLTKPVLTLADFELSWRDIILIAGGIFLLVKSTLEIHHKVEGHEENGTKTGNTATHLGFSSAIVQIVLLDIVFSFDSILSAMALTEVFWVMASAIVIGGLLMIWMADRVAQFLEKNRMYEVLGLFILFVVGIMLLSDGGHMAHLHLFGYAVTPMSKATFYFVIAILVLTDIVQTRYKKKLLKRAL